MFLALDHVYLLDVCVSRVFAPHEQGCIIRGASYVVGTVFCHKGISQFWRRTKSIHMVVLSSQLGLLL